MSVLACDPDELEATAAQLRRVAAELDATADEVSGAVVHDWSGAAAAEQAARRGTAAGLLGSFVSPVEQLAAGLAQVAGAAREEGAVVRRHLRLGEEVALERSRLLALGAPADPVAAQRWSARVGELEVEQRWHESLVAEAERRYGITEQTVAELLDRLRAAVPEPVKDLWLLVATAKLSAKFLKQGGLAVGSGAAARRLRSLGGAGGERTLHQIQQRIRGQVRGLAPRPPAWAARLPGVPWVTGALGRVAPVLVVLDAGPRVLDGGGHGGWRGSTTRVLAGAAVGGAAVAGAVALGVVAAPVAGAVGLGAVAVYQGWTVGNYVYDERAAIGRSLSRTWSRGRTAVVKLYERQARLNEERVARDEREREAARARARERRRAEDPDPVAPGIVPPGTVPPGVHA